MRTHRVLASVASRQILTLELVLIGPVRHPPFPLPIKISLKLDLKRDVGSSAAGLYELVAIITHKGATADAGGVAIAVAEIEEEDEDWHKFDDDKVSVFPVEKIPTLEGGGEDYIAYSHAASSHSLSRKVDLADLLLLQRREYVFFHFDSQTTDSDLPRIIQSNRTTADGKTRDRAFNTSVLDPIFRIFNAVMNFKKDAIAPILEKLDIKLAPEERDQEGKALLKTIMRHFLPASHYPVELHHRRWEDPIFNAVMNFKKDAIAPILEKLDIKLAPEERDQEGEALLKTIMRHFLPAGDSLPSTSPPPPPLSPTVLRPPTRVPWMTIPDSSRNDFNLHARVSADEYGWDITDARKIWCFGPDTTGPNVLVDIIKGAQFLNEIKCSCVAAFQSVCCEETIRGIRVNILDVTLHTDAVHRGGGQIICTMRHATYATCLLVTPGLQKPTALNDQTAVSTIQMYHGSQIIRRLKPLHRAHWGVDLSCPSSKSYLPHNMSQNPDPSSQTLRHRRSTALEGYIDPEGNPLPSPFGPTPGFQQDLVSTDAYSAMPAPPQKAYDSVTYEDWQPSSHVSQPALQTQSSQFDTASENLLHQQQQSSSSYEQLEHNSQTHYSQADAHQQQQSHVPPFEGSTQQDSLHVPAGDTRYVANPQGYITVDQEFLADNYRSYNRPPSRIPSPEPPTVNKPLPRTAYQVTLQYRRPAPAAADLDCLVAGFDREANDDLKAYVESFKTVTRFTQFSITVPPRSLEGPSSNPTPAAGPSSHPSQGPPPGASIPNPQEPGNINIDQPTFSTPDLSFSITQALGKVEVWRITSSFSDFIRSIESVPVTTPIMMGKKEVAEDEGLLEAVETLTVSMVASQILAGVYLTPQNVKAYVEELIEKSPEIAVIVAARYGIFIEKGTYMYQAAEQGGYRAVVPEGCGQLFRDCVKVLVVDNTVDFLTHFRHCANMFVADFAIKDRHLAPDVAHHIHSDGALRVSIAFHGKCGSDLHRYNFKSKLDYKSKFNWAWPELGLPGEPAFNCFRWAIDIKQKGENSVFGVQLLRSGINCTTLTMMMGHMAGYAPIALVRYLNRENPWIAAQLGPEIDGFRYITPIAYSSAIVSSVFAAYEREGAGLDPTEMLSSPDIEDLFQNKLLCTLSFMKFKIQNGKPSEKLDMEWLNGLCAFRGAEASYPSRWVEAMGDFAAVFGPEDVDPTMPPSLRNDTVSHIVQNFPNLNNSGGYYRRSVHLKHMETRKRHMQVPSDMLPAMARTARAIEPWLAPVSWGNFIAPPPPGYTFALSHPFLPAYFQPTTRATMNERGITTHWRQRHTSQAVASGSQAVASGSQAAASGSQAAASGSQTVASGSQAHPLSRVQQGAPRGAPSPPVGNVTMSED
ncbi:hypothetical protein D9611_014721 [Ephemerocybe angulata]|uniref:USP domain-containing protein n=1 Tax=Ephemerocybe angulata TaxID=980116 RepID=A0A8H5B8S5_9AGAR|nr:hypothetical protein D9611_014721 [Tulosesus angulatus]